MSMKTNEPPAFVLGFLLGFEIGIVDSMRKLTCDGSHVIWPSPFWNGYTAACKAWREGRI